MPGVLRPYAPPGGARLVLRCGAREVEGTPQRDTLQLGRSDQNDVVVNHSLVSRSHAVIEYRHGKFVLKDRSTNGTYVLLDGGEKFFVHREEMYSKQESDRGKAELIIGNQRYHVGPHGAPREGPRPLHGGVRLSEIDDEALAQDDPDSRAGAEDKGADLERLEALRRAAGLRAGGLGSGEQEGGEKGNEAQHDVLPR